MSGDKPIVIEIDEASWKQHLDRIEPWLGTTLTAQSAFRQLLEQVGPTMVEPHARQAVALQAETARRHEAEAERFFSLIGRDPSAARKAMGSVLAPAQRGATAALAATGGVGGNWPGLQGLVPAALNAQTGFAVAEQLGLAIGHRELAEAAYDVENEQAGGMLLLKELMLEVAAMAILYKIPV